MTKITLTIVFSLASLMVASVAGAAGCTQVGGHAYYSDGVSLFKDSACHQEMTQAELNASAATVSATGTGSANCRYDAAGSRYTDGVSFFSDAKCQNEIVPGQSFTVAQADVSQAATAQPAVTSAQYAALSQRIDALDKRITGLQSIIVQILALLAKI